MHTPHLSEAPSFWNGCKVNTSSVSRRVDKETSRGSLGDQLLWMSSLCHHTWLAVERPTKGPLDLATSEQQTMISYQLLSCCFFFIGSFAAEFKMISDLGRVPEVGAFSHLLKDSLFMNITWYRPNFTSFISGCIHWFLTALQSNRGSSLTYGARPLSLTDEWSFTCSLHVCVGTPVSSHNPLEETYTMGWSEMKSPLGVSVCVF